MSEQDNRLDSVFRRKVNSKEIEFREEDWLKARKLIDADRRNRKKRFFMIFFILLAMLSAGITTTLVMIPNNRTTASRTPAITAPENIAGTGSDERTASLPYPDTGENSSSPTADPSAVTRPVKKAGTPAISRPVNVPHNGEQPGGRKAALQQLKAKNAAAHSGKKRQRKPFPPGADAAYIAIPSTDTVTNEAITTNTIPDTVLISTKAGRPFFKLSALCDTCTKTVDAYLAYHNPEERRRSSLSIETGLNMYNNGLNFNCGLMYRWFAMRRLSLHTGVLYTRIHQDLTPRYFSASDYTFGVMPVSQSIQTTRLDYIEIPLNIAFHFTPHHALSAGASYLHLLQSADIVTKTDMNGVTKEQKDNGYITVFNAYDIQANISYRFSLNRNWYATAGYYTGLVDITNDNKYSLKEVNKNSGFRLSVGYNLW